MFDKLFSSLSKGDFIYASSLVAEVLGTKSGYYSARLDNGSLIWVSIKTGRESGGIRRFWSYCPDPEAVRKANKEREAKVRAGAIEAYQRRQARIDAVKQANPTLIVKPTFLDLDGYVLRFQTQFINRFGIPGVIDFSVRESTRVTILDADGNFSETTVYELTNVVGFVPDSPSGKEYRTSMPSRIGDFSSVEEGLIELISYFYWD